MGRVTRAHGLRGEVVVELFTPRQERVAPGSVLQSDGGPLEVVSSRPHQGRWIVAFSGVPDRAAADRLRGTALRATAFPDPDELWVHELLGAEVVDPDGAVLGRCTDVLDNPAADLIVLDGGGLIPVSFVVGHEPGRVTVDPPAGLLEP